MIIYSLLPAAVALIFLAYGIYIIKAKGISHVTVAFTTMCIFTFIWQFSWAVLFQIDDISLAKDIIKTGWIFILFLPTSLYHFLSEISYKESERLYVYSSYAFSVSLFILLLTTDYVINGYHHYFYGYYPKAGLLHPLHLLQTFIVVSRGLYITYTKFHIIQGNERKKLKHCTASLFIYFFAAIDYLCNYGIAIYPFGAFFTTISLGVMAYAIIKYHMMDESRLMISTVVHEMRTPMAILRSQSEILSNYLPELINNYYPPKGHEKIPKEALDGILELSKNIKNESKQLNIAVNLLTAMECYDHISEKDLYPFNIKNCIEECLKRMPNREELEAHVDINIETHLEIFASKEFFSIVIINLIKNACEARKAEGDLHIVINAYQKKGKNIIEIIDYGKGIEEQKVPHIFDKHYTTKRRGVNSGIGLAICKKIIHSFYGKITCSSIPNQQTTFTITLPAKQTGNDMHPKTL